MYLFKVFLISFFLLFSANFASQAQENGYTSTHTLLLDGIERGYNIYMPPIVGSQKLPLMIALHGGMGNASYMEKTSGLNNIANHGPFIVVYPEGTGGRFSSMKNRRTWNSGRCCGVATRQNTDDVKFIETMIDKIVSNYPVDGNRIYVTGMSNGAMMAYRLACEIPERISAVIPVSGTLATENCENAVNIPIMHIHGDQDNNVPFSGGRGSNSIARVSHRSVPETVKILTEPRNCKQPQVQYGNSGIAKSEYHCKGGAPFTLVVLEGGGHSWPGGQGRTQTSSQASDNFSASEQAWLFAKQFSKTDQ